MTLRPRSRNSLRPTGPHLDPLLDRFELHLDGLVERRLFTYPIRFSESATGEEGTRPRN